MTPGWENLNSQSPSPPLPHRMYIYIHGDRLCLPAETKLLGLLCLLVTGNITKEEKEISLVGRQEVWRF
jgi:hypothetical protein